MSKNEIAIDSIGPIKHLRIPVSEDGGVYVLHGANGSGKTTALNAVQALASGTGRIEQSDDEPVGEVSAFGATLRVARRLSRIGELSVESLEGRFSISDVVDPKIADPLAADAKRIKALIQLADRGKADPSLFYDIVGGQEAFDQYITKESASASDLVLMAGKIKRDLEAHARTYAADAERDFNKADAARLSTEGIDINAPHDSKELAEALSKADREEQRIRSEIKAAEEAKQNQKLAKESLQKTRDSYTGEDVETATAILAVASDAVAISKIKVEDLKRHLAAAEADLKANEADVKLAESGLQAAKSYEAAVEGFEAILFAPVSEAPTEKQLLIAQQRLQEALEAVERGSAVRSAITALENASKLKEAAKESQRKAVLLREAAKATDDVLSKEVQKLKCPLRVSHSRLVTDTDRGEEPFAELSEGEKYALIIPIAIEAVGKGGLLTLSQEAWQGLDPNNRHMIASKVEGTGVILLAAEASDDDEIRVEQFEAFPLG